MYMMSISQESHQIIRQTYKRLMKILLVTVIFLFPTIISASNSFYASALNGFNEKNFEKAIKYLEKDIVNFEPKIALDGGLDGISEIRKIVKKSSELIKKGGKLILEIAFDQKKEVKQLLVNNGFYINSVIKDLANNDRCIISTKIEK